MSICEYSYRKAGHADVYCHRLDGEKYPICGHTYMCREKRRFEISGNAKNCRLRLKAAENIQRNEKY